MRIGILGAGRMADALGAQWARAGHELMIGGRDPARAAATAERITAVGPEHPVTSGSLAAAARFGAVLLLAVPGQSARPVLESVGARQGALRNKVIIDCTNSIVPDQVMLAETGGASVAELIADAATGAHVVKAFNLCHEDVWRMRPPVFHERPLIVPLCGDDAGAVATVGSLVSDLGCSPAPAGGLQRAHLLEATAALLIGLWFGGIDAQAIAPPLPFALGARE